jgi:hypothetical protein
MTPERKKKYSSWERRLNSMYSKARYIMNEALDELGDEHPYTDELDNLLVALEDLTNDTPKFKSGQYGADVID